VYGILRSTVCERRKAMKKSYSFLGICLAAVALVASYSWGSPSVRAGHAGKVQGQTMPAPVPPSGNERGVALAPAGPNSNERPATPPNAAELEAASTTAASGSGYLVLPPAAFTSDGLIPDGFFVYFGGGYFVGQVESSACVLAPVNLPAGVQITSLEARLDDQNSDAYEWFDLYRINLQTGNAEIIASVSSPTGTTGGVVSLVDTTITSPEVSDMYAYQLCTCTRLAIYVYGARIGYTSTTFLPLTTKDHVP
jgi:hypothetical protein